MFTAYLKTFENDRDFTSRTGRKDLWRASWVDIIVWAVLIISYFCFKDINLLYVILAALYFFVTLTSRFALWVRRLHDTGIKGTFAFVALIPVLGTFALLFIFMSDSQPKDNIYGKYIPEPKKKKKNNK
ncbi:MAG: DUF805 domain-containing protein [Clostridia bacterium]|nr:DUF805 domain-containing protein [Clostridia bacterium]